MTLRQKLFLVIALGYTAGVLYFSWIPTSPPTGSDMAVLVKRWLFNLLHVPVYTGMMAVWYATLRPKLDWSWLRALAAVGIAAGIGGIGELGQYWVPGRYPGWDDETLNFVGACLGAWALYYLKVRRHVRKTGVERK